MGQYRLHCFVCTSGKVCPRQGSEQVLAELRMRVKSAGLTDEIRINQSGCLSQCGHGPMVVVYPEDTWYAAVRPEDAAEIFTSHLLSGRRVERLLYRPAGPGKQIARPGTECIPPVDPPPA